VTLLGPISVKLERANKHVVDLNRAREAFFASQKYSITHKDDAQTGERTYYLHGLSDIPAEFSAITGDALQNFRSALDYLIHELVAIAGNRPTINTAFPIADSAANYTKRFFERKIYGLRPDAEKFLHSLKPYKGGNETLWRLHRLNNIDKHRLLLSAVTGHSAHLILPTQEARLKQLFFGSHPWCDVAPDLRGTLIALKSPIPPLQEGSKLLTVPVSEIQDNMKFAFDIAFDQTGVADGEPIITALNEIGRVVTEIVWSFKRANLF
jgi:hypothetical protein